MRKAVLLFAQLNDRDVDWMGRNGQVAELPAGHRLIEAGQRVSAIYVVLGGTLAVIQGETAIAILGPGEVVGEISMIVHRPPSASVIAESRVRVLAIGMTHLRSHLARDGEFAANFYHGLTILLANRLRRTTRQLGYGREGDPVDSVEVDEDVETDAIDGLRLAQERFARLVRRFEEPVPA